MYYKNDDIFTCFYVALRSNFGNFWPPTWGVQGGPSRPSSLPLGVLRWSWAPRSPQDHPRPPQTPPKADFLMILMPQLPQTSPKSLKTPSKTPPHPQDLSIFTDVLHLICPQCTGSCVKNLLEWKGRRWLAPWASSIEIEIEIDIDIDIDIDINIDIDIDIDRYRYRYRYKHRYICGYKYKYIYILID